PIVISEATSLSDREHVELGEAMLGLVNLRENRSARNLVIIACLFIIAAGLKAAGDLLTPLLVSLFFSVLCIPPLERLKSRGVPDGIAIAIVILAATITVIAITAIIG